MTKKKFVNSFYHKKDPIITLPVSVIYCKAVSILVLWKTCQLDKTALKTPSCFGVLLKDQNEYQLLHRITKHSDITNLQYFPAKWWLQKLLQFHVEFAASYSSYSSSSHVQNLDEWLEFWRCRKTICTSWMNCSTSLVDFTNILQVAFLTTFYGTKITAFLYLLYCL